ncbi:MAG: hypothetical protein ACFE0J_26575, partial [Elainellaceae cyanobacterium]
NSTVINTTLIMDRSKLVAIITGAIALLLSIGYLILVQLLDFRGEMLPAPQGMIMVQTLISGLEQLTGLWG